MKSYKEFINKHTDRFCDIKGNCMYKAYELSKDLYANGISHKIIEGYVTFSDAKDEYGYVKFSHTWVEVNKEVIDITLAQFREYNLSSVKYIKKYTYTPEEYYKLDDMYGKPSRVE
jgi:hypothetical protein